MNYFTLEEARCKPSGHAYPAIYVADGTWAKIRGSGNLVREAWGGPLNGSFYRDPEYNEQLRERSIMRLMARGLTRDAAEQRSGVAKESKHMFGQAVDLTPLDPSRSPELHKLIIAMIKADKLPLIGGVGKYPLWVHIDVRPRLANGKIVQW